MPNRLIKYFLLSLILLAFLLPNFNIFSLTPEEERKLLEEELKELEEQIAQYEKDITKTQQEKRTLQNQVYILKNKVKKLNLQIQESSVMIKDIGLQIKDTEGSIEVTGLNIEDSRIKLANILRLIYEEDQKSLLEILLTEDELSDFFANLVALENLSERSSQLLKNIKTLKSQLENQKESLGEEKEDLERVTKIQRLQKQESEATKKEEEYLLKLTEAQYQQYLKEKQELEKRVSEIMSRIAQLTLPGLEVPTSKKELYELANWAGKLTGVRPALILGLIEVESALGTNVGQCNCAGQPYCRHPNISYKRAMSSKQWNSFLKITKELGLDPNTTPVSCAVSGGMVQMGGAMGPAQFMPNTWYKFGYKQKVESITGVVPANPWRARDAFLASALYLADWNANTQKYQQEIGAVTAYLCGTSVMTSRCKQAGGNWYRNLVMQKANQWQVWINQGF